MLYVRENIRIKNCELVNILGTNSLKLKILCPGSVEESNLLLLYLLYGDCTSSRLQFTESLERELQSENGKQIILFGDININLLNENDASEYHNMLISQGCLSFQNEPT